MTVASVLGVVPVALVVEPDGAVVGAADADADLLLQAYSSDEAPPITGLP